MRISFLVIFLLSNFCFQADAAGIQDWIKKGGGYKRTRKVTSKQTMVAAVRGVEEPGDVDPSARNFDGLQKIESRNISQDQLSKFIEEGKLRSAKK